MSDRWQFHRKFLGPRCRYTRNQTLRLIVALGKDNLITSAMLEVGRIAFAVLTPFVLQVNVNNNK